MQPGLRTKIRVAHTLDRKGKNLRQPPPQELTTLNAANAHCNRKRSAVLVMKESALPRLSIDSGKVAATQLQRLWPAKDKTQSAMEFVMI